MNEVLFMHSPIFLVGGDLDLFRAKAKKEVGAWSISRKNVRNERISDGRACQGHGTQHHLPGPSFLLMMSSAHHSPLCPCMKEHPLRLLVDKSEFPSLLSSKKSRIPPRLKKRTPIQPSSIPVKPYQYAWEQCSSCHY
ncbi:hypothetical protein RIF29_47041 [Crotalaria pallida]|uniref:Uncharacterized protein n=1 Tax=Crotalaria pallida TaxID=3830 RepID=A0AAN9HK04_CROPI